VGGHSQHLVVVSCGQVVSHHLGTGLHLLPLRNSSDLPPTPQLLLFMMMYCVDRGQLAARSLRGIPPQLSVGTPDPGTWPRQGGVLPQSLAIAREDTQAAQTSAHMDADRMTTALGWGYEEGRLCGSHLCGSLTLLTTLAVIVLLYNLAPFSCKVAILWPAAHTVGFVKSGWGEGKAKGGEGKGRGQRNRFCSGC
jgi:hypothetical protein